MILTQERVGVRLAHEVIYLTEGDSPGKGSESCEVVYDDSNKKKLVKKRREILSLSCGLVISVIIKCVR